MTSEPIKVLLVEDNPENIRLIREMLKEAKPAMAALEDAPSLLTAVERLAKGGIDAVLLDLGLPDSQGISTFVELNHQFPGTPIVVLTGLTDEKLGLQAVREGAQDYLVIGKVNGEWICRAVLYAVERMHVKAALDVEASSSIACSLKETLRGYTALPWTAASRTVMKLSSRSSDLPLVKRS